MTTTLRLVCRGCHQELSWTKDGIEHQCHPIARMRARHARMTLKHKLELVAQDLRTMHAEGQG